MNSMAINIQHRSERVLRRLTHLDLKMSRLRDLKLASGLTFFAGLVLFYIWPGRSFLLLVPGLAMLVWIWGTSQVSKLEKHRQDLRGLSSLLRRLVLKQEGQLRRIFDERIGLTPPYSTSKATGRDDLDLEGDFSLTTLLDECATKQGAYKLKLWLSLTSSVASEEIRLRQQTVLSLASHPARLFRAGRLNAVAENLEASQRIDIEGAIRAWDQPVLEKSVYVLSLIALWFVAIAAALHLGANHSVASGLWTVFVLLNIVCARSIGRPFAQLDSNLRRLADLRSLIQIVKRSSTFAVNSKNLDIEGLERTASLLSTETNPYVHFGLHLLAPWTPFWSLVAEKQRRQLVLGLASVGPEVETYDATRCFALLSAFFNTHMPQLLPSKTENADATLLSAEGLHHPLLDPKKAVRNDFVITRPRPLALITGSNMAGKSTWLRALALNLALLRAGAPVFAKSMKAVPLPMLVSLRLSDSLEDGSSYFSAEADRIVQLVKAAQASACWYFIDEMFRGTNSRERLLAGRSVIAQLQDTLSTGLVASHDTALGTDPRLSENLANWHFREEAAAASAKSDLTFDYKLREGVATETNALRILQSRGLRILNDS